MLRLFFLFISLLTLVTASAQIKAVTENGDEVILNADGTWLYLNEGIQETDIPTNKSKFTKSSSASFLLKSKIGLGFYMDPKKWKFSKGTSDEDAEFNIELKNGDLYAIIISEKFDIPLASMREIALINGRDAAPDLHIVKQEYRMVNGIKVLMLEMNGTVQGIKVAYVSYYFSDEDGTVQFVTYTSQSMLKDYRDDIEELLNGMVKL